MFGRPLIVTWTFLLMSMMIGAAQAADQIYGWVDDSGHFTYSNLPPPPNVRVLDVIPVDATPSAAPVAASTRSDLAAMKQELLELQRERSLPTPTGYDLLPSPAWIPEAAPCGVDLYDCAPWSSGYSYVVAWRGGRWAYTRRPGHAWGLRGPGPASHVLTATRAASSRR